MLTDPNFPSEARESAGYTQHIQLLTPDSDQQGPTHDSSPECAPRGRGEGEKKGGWGQEGGGRGKVREVRGRKKRMGRGEPESRAELGEQHSKERNKRIGRGEAVSGAELATALKRAETAGCFPIVAGLYSMHVRNRAAAGAAPAARPCPSR